MKTHVRDIPMKFQKCVVQTLPRDKFDQSTQINYTNIIRKREGSEFRKWISFIFCFLRGRTKKSQIISWQKRHCFNNDIKIIASSNE